MQTQSLFQKLQKDPELLKAPLFMPILMHFAARYIGRTYAEFACDYKVLVEANIKCMEDFGMDAVGLISDPYRETAAFGAQMGFPAEQVPVCKNKLIKSLEDVKALKNPDVYKSERTLDRINGAIEFRKRLGNDFPVFGWIEGPLAEACDLVDLAEMLMKLIIDPDFVNYLLDKVTITAKDFAKAQIDAGCDIIGIGDAICSQISPNNYRDFVLERHIEIIEVIYSLGALVKLHICGNITHLLPEIKQTRADIVDLDHMVDLGRAHELLGADIICCGNIDPVSVIQNLPQSQIETMARDLVTSEQGKRFVLSGACEITVNTSPENLMAMKKACSS